MPQEDTAVNDKVVDFAEAKDRLAPERKEKAAKALRKQFQQARKIAPFQRFPKPSQ